MDESAERYLHRLDRRFDAEVARQEELAAADLARALAQDRSLREVITASPGRVVLLSSAAPDEIVTAVGRDYVATGRPHQSITRLASARLRLSEKGDPPSTRSDSFHEVARRWARGGERVQVFLDDALQRGRLSLVGTDCLMLGTGEGQTIVALERVRSIRLAPAG